MNFDPFIISKIIESVNWSLATCISKSTNMIKRNVQELHKVTPYEIYAIEAVAEWSFRISIIPNK